MISIDSTSRYPTDITRYAIQERTPLSVCHARRADRLAHTILSIEVPTTKHLVHTPKHQDFTLFKSPVITSSATTLAFFINRMLRSFLMFFFHVSVSNGCAALALDSMARYCENRRMKMVSMKSDQYRGSPPLSERGNQETSLR